jgi:hypothetical protein
MAELGRADAEFEHELCVGWTETASASFAAPSHPRGGAPPTPPISARARLSFSAAARCVALTTAAPLFPVHRVPSLRLRRARSAGVEARARVQPHCARRAQRVVRLRLRDEGACSCSFVALLFVCSSLFISFDRRCTSGATTRRSCAQSAVGESATTCRRRGATTRPASCPATRSGRRSSGRSGCTASTYTLPTTAAASRGASTR